MSVGERRSQVAQAIVIGDLHTQGFFRTARQVMALSVDILSNPIHSAWHLLTTNNNNKNKTLYSLVKKYSKLGGKIIRRPIGLRLIRICSYPSVFNPSSSVWLWPNRQLFIAPLSLSRKIIIKRILKTRKAKNNKGRKPPKQKKRAAIIISYTFIHHRAEPASIVSRRL